MTRVTATEFKNNIGAFSDAAMHSPVVITRHHRDRLVLMSAEEYQRLADSAKDMPSAMQERTNRNLATHRDTIIELAKR